MAVVRAMQAHIEDVANCACHHPCGSAHSCCFPDAEWPAHAGSSTFDWSEIGAPQPLLTSIAYAVLQHDSALGKHFPRDVSAALRCRRFLFSAANTHKVNASKQHVSAVARFVCIGVAALP